MSGGLPGVARFVVDIVGLASRRLHAAKLIEHRHDSRRQ